MHSREYNESIGVFKQLSCNKITCGYVQSRPSVFLFVRALTGNGWAISTKIGTRILYSSRSACIDPEVKRSKVKVTQLRKPSWRTVASDHGPYSAYPYASVLPAAVGGVGLHVDTTAYVS